MSTFRMIPHRLVRFLPAAMLLLSNEAVAAGNGTADASGRDNLGPALCRAFESGTRGYSLRCPKRMDPFRGENTRLQATYTIGEGEPRQAEVFGDATSWLVHIADRALPGDSVTVSLTFYFEPSDAVRQELKAELKKLDKALVEGVTQALRTHGEAWTTHFSINPEENKYALLKEARLRDGTRTLPTLLKGLGFRQDPAGQRWVPTDETLGILNETALRESGTGLLAPKLLELTESGASTCVTLLGEGALGEAPQALISTATRCLEKAASVAKAPASSTPPVGAKPGAGGAPVKNPCQELFSPVITEAKRLGDSASGEALSKASGALGAAQERGKKDGCSEETLNALASASSLLTLAQHLGAAARVEAALQARVDEVAAVIAVTFELADIRSDILEAEAERRGYSLSSGAVYLTGLNDLVYPVAVSVCPVLGCLRGDEQFWFSKSSFVRSFSAEIGIAAVTADNHDDARRRGGPGFLLGLSWQALAPFKLSGGTLFFENQETRGWQFDGFLGVTLDAAKAVEMMGLFGIAVPVQLKSTGSKPDSR